MKIKIDYNGTDPINLSYLCISGGTRRLDAFLSSHTSEDNESFQEIMREADLRHRHRVSNFFSHF